MKILFLDFDGVLNSSEFFERSRLREIGETDKEHKLSMLDPKAVGLLNKIIEETGCEVVISSTWRLGNKLEFLVNLLVVKGLNKDFRRNFIGVTPRIAGSERGHEIQKWLDENPAEKFVILDDDGDMAHLMSNLVWCDFLTGLTLELAEETIRRLK